MIDESLKRLERQLANTSPTHAPAELRDLVLGRVNKRLAVNRWDRHLARAAIVLLAVGVGSNLFIALGESTSSQDIVVQKPTTPETIIQMGVAMAEATDAETGDRFARHVAALNGRTLTDRQLAAIQEGARKRSMHVPPSQKEG